MTLRLAFVLALAAAMNGPSLAGATMPGQTAPEADGIGRLLQRLERIAQGPDPDQYLQLLSETADAAAARQFIKAELRPGATRVAVRERDREALRGTLPGAGYRLSLDVFTESGMRARSDSWRLDVKRISEDPADGWRIVDQERLTQVENLFRLSLDPAQQFDARDLRIIAEDLDLVLSEGSLFMVASDDGPTGVVLLGRGELRFHPAPAVEKGQLKIFCGAETLETRFDATYVRMNPQDLDALLDSSRLTPRRVDARDFRRADELFKEHVAKSFAVDMTDLSRELWSIMPQAGDFLAEIHTPRYGTLTYVRAGAEPEDISFFDRKRRKNISVYSSIQARERFGRSYNEDDLVSYDVLGYDLDVMVSPDRQSIEGRARLHLRVVATAINSITLRLAETLTVHSIASNDFGRLLGVRVRNQNTIIVNLPAPLLHDDDLLLTVMYGGKLEPQGEDVEALQTAPRTSPSGQSPEDSLPVFQPERSFLYSNRSYWYPQATVTDYATASLRITVPARFDCVASGTLDEGFPTAIGGTDGAPARKVYLFTTAQPLRYLAFVLSTFVRAETVNVPTGGGGNVGLVVHANPRQVRRGRELGERASDIIRFYDSLIGDSPFPSFTLALVESELPGGHSPGYFAALNQPLPNTPYVWRNDPASFEDFPEFFIAHEIAHQWWGQAVGWRNYHEQWLSEGLAQYFAALYAQHRRGGETFGGVLRQFRRWGMQQADQGPISLGYRLGHIRGDSRVFRAVIYNKSAAVLHMLRRLIGDEAFFQGIRRFYGAARFKKAGTDDLREAMETESGRSLEQFFEQWIYGTALPRLKFGYRIEPGADGQRIVLHVEQIGELFELPLTVTLTYADKRDVQVIIPVAERVVDYPVVLAGPLRAAEVNRDEMPLAEIVRN